MTANHLQTIVETTSNTLYILNTKQITSNICSSISVLVHITSCELFSRIMQMLF
jgi:hypothetical protein